MTLFTSKKHIMEEQNTPQTAPGAPAGAKTTAGQTLGIVGLVLGILALIVAFIPCVGVIALVPGLIAVIFSVIALVQANQNNGAKGLIIAALVVSILATSIAAIWGIVIGGASREGHRFREGVERFIESADQEAIQELRTSVKQLGKELERTFGDMEDFDPELYDFGEEISDEEFEQVLADYDMLVRELAALVREVEDGQLSALVKYSNVSIRAASMAATLVRIGPKLTEEQQKRFEEVSGRHEEILDEMEE